MFTFRRTGNSSSQEPKSFQRKFFLISVGNDLKRVLYKFKGVVAFGRRKGESAYCLVRKIRRLSFSSEGIENNYIYKYICNMNLEMQENCSP